MGKPPGNMGLKSLYSSAAYLSREDIIFRVCMPFI